MVSGEDACVRGGASTEDPQKRIFEGVTLLWAQVGLSVRERTHFWDIAPVRHSYSSAYSL